jgi:hypothetical protein
VEKMQAPAVWSLIEQSLLCVTKEEFSMFGMSWCYVVGVVIGHGFRSYVSRRAPNAEYEMYEGIGRSSSGWMLMDYVRRCAARLL